MGLLSDSITFQLSGQQQQGQGGNDIASLNLGGGSNGAPIEVGSNTPVDMGMFGANNQGTGLCSCIVCIDDV